MRVAVVTQHFPNSEQQWAGHAAYQTIRALTEYCDVEVFYPESSYHRFLTPASSKRPPLDRTWSPPGIKANYIPYPAIPVISRSLNGLVMTQYLLPHVRRFQPDVILNYTIYPDGFAAVRIGRALGVPSVITAVGSDLNNISDRMCGVFTRWGLRHADFVRTVSYDLCNTARRMGADPARSCANLNGCDTSLFRPQDRRETRRKLELDVDAETVVYIGRLDVRKGLVELIDAAAQLKPKRPALHCYIVGDGADRPVLVDAIERNKAADFVTLVPGKLNDQVALWIAAADVVTLPSYNEGCPNVVIETLASGRPMVATRVGGIPELMDDSSGRLIPVKDVPALVKALDEALTQEWNADELSSRHSRSWGDVARELYPILASTLRR